MNKNIAGSYSKVAKDCMLEVANEILLVMMCDLQCHVPRGKEDFHRFWELSS